MNAVDKKLHIQTEDKKISSHLEKIKHRIVVFSGKGGVGKTTVSVNLAFALHLRGFNTGILDADITGPNVSKMLGIAGILEAEGEKLIPRQSHGVKVVSVANIVPPNQPVIWRGPLRSKLLNQFLGDAQWGTLDYLIADLPPGTGDEILTMTQKMEPHLAIIVTTPQQVSLIDSARAANMARTMKIPHIGLVENMSGLTCPKCGHQIDLFGSGGGRKQAEEMDIHFLGALPINLETRQLADEGKPIMLVDQNADISLATEKIVDKIEDMLRG